ncbi:hypothetical protein HYX17_05260 [Candidatus Woesearchaeota archaeon]|nr:hypothetical protein [Candidatus Woesearchaeota archaeon]
MAVSIKISDENYKRLASLSGRLREELHKPISINEAINFLYIKRKISELAGSWEMTDKEAEDFMGNLKRGWKRWTIKSA